MTVTKEQKKQILLTFFKDQEWSLDSEGKLLWFSKKTDEPSEEKFKELASVLELNKLKEQKLKDLQELYNDSKKITIKNGKTLVINHDTPERKFFKKNLERTPNLDNLTIFKTHKHEVLDYWQTQGEETLGFASDSLIWAEIFSSLFSSNGRNLFSENKKIYDSSKSKINNCNSKEDLSKINLKDLFKSGIIVNVNEEAEKILKKYKPSILSVSAENKLKKQITQAIKDLKGKDGQIHLIQKIG